MIKKLGWPGVIGLVIVAVLIRNWIIEHAQAITHGVSVITIAVLVSIGTIVLAVGIGLFVRYRITGSIFHPGVQRQRTSRTVSTISVPTLSDPAPARGFDKRSIDSGLAVADRATHQYRKWRDHWQHVASSRMGWFRFWRFNHTCATWLHDLFRRWFGFAMCKWQHWWLVAPTGLLVLLDMCIYWFFRDRLEVAKHNLGNAFSEINAAIDAKQSVDDLTPLRDDMMNLLHPKEPSEKSAGGSAGEPAAAVVAEATAATAQAAADEPPGEPTVPAEP